MLPKALREYVTVTVEPTTTLRTRRRHERPPASRRRRAPFRLDSAARRGLRLRLRHRRAALRRRPDDARGVAATRSRARAASRATARRSRPSSPRSRRDRGAPPAARTAAAGSLGSRHRGGRHRSAGRRVRRPALHAAQGHHGDPARPQGRTRSTTCRPSPCSGWMPRITTGKRCGAVRCSTASSSRARHACRARGGRRASGRALDAGRPHRAEPRRTRRALARDGFHRLGRCAARAPRTGRASAMADAFARWLEDAARTATGWSSSSRRIRRPSRSSPTSSRASCARPAAPPRSPRRPAMSSPRAAISRRSMPQPDSIVALSSRRRAAPHPPQGDTSSSARQRTRSQALAEEARPRRPDASARTCCSARSSRTRSSPRSATSPARASSPISVSFAACTSSFGVPMPLMYPRATATLVDSAAARFLAKLRPADRGAAARRTKRC